MRSASLFVSATSTARSSLAWRSEALSQERQNETDFYPRGIESFLDLIKAIADRRIEPIKPSLDQRLHPIRELEGLALIWPGALRICRIAGALEFRLNDDQAISDAVVHQCIDAAVISAIDKRADPDRIFGRAQSANGVGGKRT